MVWFFIFASILIVSSLSLIGLLTLGINEKKLKKALLYIVGFSTGALLGDAFLHLLPEAVSEQGFTLSVSLSVLAGIAVSFVIEKIIHWRHCHGHDHHHPFAYMNLIGDAVHNFLDGIIIAAAYIGSIPLGIATTIAVILHEIPQEIGDFAVLLQGGFTKKKALFFNGLTALCAFIGALFAFFLSGVYASLEIFLVPFAAGNFIYIAGSDLIPELHKEIGLRKALLQLGCILLGIGVMCSLLFLE